MRKAITLKEFSRISIISIKRPEVNNAMTAEMWRELEEVVDRAGARAETRVIILRGAFKYFSAGSDIEQFAHLEPQEVNQAFLEMENAIRRVQTQRVPTIACIKGAAMGAGLQLALACDLRVTEPKARFGIPVAKLGITIGESFAKRILQIIGPSKTKDLLFTGRNIDGESAYQWGLVDYLVEKGTVESYSLKLAHTIAHNSSASVINSKKVISQLLGDYPEENEVSFLDEEDFYEGVAAFLTKRKPIFKP